MIKLFILNQPNKLENLMLKLLTFIQEFIYTYRSHGINKNIKIIIQKSAFYYIIKII